MQNFARIDRLPPYGLAIVDDLKMQARRAGEDMIDFGRGTPNNSLFADGDSLHLPLEPTEQLLDEIRPTCRRHWPRLEVLVLNFRHHPTTMCKEAEVAVSLGIGFGGGGDQRVRFALVENEHRTRQALGGLRRLC